MCNYRGQVAWQIEYYMIRNIPQCERVCEYGTYGIPRYFQCDISLMSRPTDLNGKFKPAWCQSRSPRLLHQDVTKGCGVPVAIIWVVQVGAVSSAGVSAAAEPNVGVVWVTITLLVGEDTDPDLEVCCFCIETLPVAVHLQGAIPQQTLPLVAPQWCLMVVTTSYQGMERICRYVNRFERPVASVVHSNAHFGEGSGPVSSEFRLLLVEAVKSSCGVEWDLVFPQWWIPLKGVLKLIVTVIGHDRYL